MEISSLFSAKAVAQADPQAADRALARAGITREALADPASTVDVSQHHALFEALAEAERPDIGIHMRTSASMRCEDFGTLGLTMRSAPDLRGALTRLDRYVRLFNRYSVFALSDFGSEWWWTNSRGADSDGARLSHEAGLGTFLTLWRDANGEDLTPARVQFMHQPVGSIAPLEALFRCPVTFGAQIDAIVLRSEDLDRPNRVGDRHIWEFLRGHLEESIAGTEEGCRDVVDDGENGLLAPVRDAGALALAVEKLLASPSLRERFGDAARRKAVAEFNERKVVERMMRLYDELLAGKPRA